MLIIMRGKNSVTKSKVNKNFVESTCENVKRADSTRTSASGVPEEP